MCDGFFFLVCCGLCVCGFFVFGFFLRGRTVFCWWDYFGLFLLLIWSSLYGECFLSWEMGITAFPRACWAQWEAPWQVQCVWRAKQGQTIAVCLMWAPMLEGLCSPNQLLLVPFFTTKSPEMWLHLSLSSYKEWKVLIASGRPKNCQELGRSGQQVGRQGTVDVRFTCPFILGRMLLRDVKIMSAQIYMDTSILEAAWQPDYL